MNRSSSPSDGLLAGMFARGPAATETTDQAFLQAMLDFEVALLRALVQAGLAPAPAAETLAAVARAERFDMEDLGRSTGRDGTPVPQLVAGLRELVGEPAGGHVHRGATSQDVVDTAIMLVARRALEFVLEDLGRAADSCALLAQRHRGSVMAGRTLLQQAAPVTFGLRAAIWLSLLDGARSGLLEVRERELALQLGGAVGTLASLGDHGLEIVGVLARQLGLVEPSLPWHTVRLAPARLACASATALGAMAKVAQDVVLFAQTEVAEAADGSGAAGGRSSTMPHKRNPVGAVTVLACAHRAPGLAATVLAAMPQEHERAAGRWQAEWEPLRELLALTGSGASALREVLDGLQPDTDRMRANLVEFVMSESVVEALAERLGRPRAQAVVREAAATAAREGRGFGDVLRDLAGELDPAALDPARYLGVTDALIDRALAAHGTARRGA